MRLHHGLIFGWVGLFADGTSQSSSQTGRHAELMSKAGEEIRRSQVALVGDLMFESLGKIEMLKERNDVCESFVERKHVRITWNSETSMHSIENRVRGLVSNDVM
jgi:hypothetical protein